MSKSSARRSWAISCSGTFPISGNGSGSSSSSPQASSCSGARAELDDGGPRDREGRMIWTNVALGTVLVVITLLIHSVGLFVLSRLLKGTNSRFRPHRTRAGTVAVMTATVFGLFVVH